MYMMYTCQRELAANKGGIFPFGSNPSLPPPPPPHTHTLGGNNELGYANSPITFSEKLDCLPISIYTALRLIENGILFI